LHVSPDAWEINLAWSDNSTNETAFVVQKSTNGTAFAQIAVVPSPQAGMSDSAIAPGQHYWYRVAATNSAGLSPWSNIAEATAPTNGSGSSLPSQWQDRDIGSVGVAGSAGYSQGTFTVKASGADIWGSSDAFHYVYQTISGNGEFVARVTGLQNTDPWAKAGLMFRESLNPNAANALVMATPGHGTGFQWRTATGGGSSYVPGPFFTAPVWLKLKRQGDVVTASASLDGTTWTTIGSQTVPIVEPMFLGLAVTSHNNGVLNTATFDNLKWTASP